jgi:integrase
MYSKAKEHKMIFEVPDFAPFKEHGRSLRLNDEAEKRLSAVADQPLKDIIVVMRDTGMRNARELYCMRVENVDFDAGTIFTPDSKTESGRRFIPMSCRVKQILEARCEGRSEGWVWMSRYKGKHIGEGMVYRQWARARQVAGLPREFVLYCARHDFGSFVLAKTGNLKAVMNAMGHGDVRSAMVYQHPEGEIIRNALNARHISRPTVPDHNQVNA